MRVPSRIFDRFRCWNAYACDLQGIWTEVLVGHGHWFHDGLMYSRSTESREDFVCLDQTWWLHVKAHFEGVIEGKTPITGNNFHKVKNRFSVCIVLSKKRWSCLRIVDDRSCWMVLVLPGVYLRDRPSFLVACTWLCCSWGNDPGCCHWHYVCCGNIFVLCSCWAYGVIVTLLLLIPRWSLL